jgi:LPS-assembly protein
LKQPFIVFCLLLLTACCLRAEDEPLWSISATGGPDSFVQNDPDTGLTTAENGVSITGRGVVLLADRAQANEETGEVIAQGNVTVLGRDHLWRGTNMMYNFKTGVMRAGEFKTSFSPFFIEGERAGGRTNQSYGATNVIITADDFDKPFYKIRARRIVLYPGDHFEAHNATVMIGNVPVFYFPFYRRSFGRHPNNFVFTPGYRSVYGPFLLSTYNWQANDKLDGSLHLDYRERRGVGLGADVNDHLGHQWGDGTFKYYFAHDREPNIDGVTNTVSPVPADISNDRKRITFTHSAEPLTNLTVKTVMHYQSDPLVLRDFFEREYRKDVQPNSFVEANKVWPNWSLDALVQPRLNNFWENVSRLPDIKLMALRQQIGVTPIYYESDSDAGYFERKYAETDPINGTNDFAATRLDTFHQLTLPQTYFGWLNVTPRLGGRVTYYHNSWGNLASTNSMFNETRGVLNTGAEASFKASRVWSDAQNKAFDVNGIRHIIEPSLNYVFVPDPNVPPSKLPQFDYEVQSLRLLPIEYPEYNAIDSIDSQNVLRMTLRNKLQTKRENGIENLVHWALYTDWRLTPHPDQTMTFVETNFPSSGGGIFTPGTVQTRTFKNHQERFANVYSDMDLKPRSWLWFNSQIRYDVENRRFNETFHQVTVQPNNVWSFNLSYRYLINNDPALVGAQVQQLQGATVPIPASYFDIPGHKTITASVHYRLNENWGARAIERYEARDGTFEEQQYTIYRDLRSWTSALSFRFRENRTVRKNDFTIAITFSLKAFPRFNMGSDAEHPQLLLGSG